VEVADLTVYSYKASLQEALMLWAASALLWVSFNGKHNQMVASCLGASQCKERKIIKTTET